MAIIVFLSKSINIHQLKQFYMKKLFTNTWLGMIIFATLFISQTESGISNLTSNAPMIELNEKPNESTGMVGDSTLPSSKKELSALIKFGEGDYKYSVEDFFRNPDKTSYQISPDGKYFTYLAPYKNRMNIYVQEIGSKKAKRITKETERDIAGYFWGNNNRILFIKDSGGDENFKLFAVNKDGGDKKDLTPFEKVRISIIDDLEDLPNVIIIGMNKRNKALFEPYRLNIETGELTRLADNEDIMNPISGWMTDHDGKIRIASSISDGVNTNILYRDSEDEDFNVILTTNFKETVNPLFFDFENKNLYASSNLGRDKSAIVMFDVSTGKEIGKPMFQHPEVDVSGLSYSKKRKVLTTISYTTDKRQREFLDNEAKVLYERLEKDLGDYEIVVTSTNKNEDKFLIRTYSDMSLGAYYFYDKEKDVLTKLNDVSPWIDENDMARMQPITYTTRDGLTIYGYLTLPKGVDPKNLPVVINPHGGPWARDQWGYNPEIQLMASRGFAVLQMNFRGSTGYGRAFLEASFKEWGKKMQDDITDGVKWLIDQGIADKDRIAIYGGSYGGYATLAGVTYTPDLYNCAIDYVGVSNLFTFMNTIPPYWKPFLAMMHEMVGNPDNPEDKVLMEAASPALHIDQIKTPLLVVQGANDPRVNINESDQIVKALRERSVDVPYLVKYNEGHGFRNEENKFEFYKVMIGFLKKNMTMQETKG
jgi:dipeptidyl aminopeptidase/acylaminoacyl peptidase